MPPKTTPPVPLGERLGKRLRELRMTQRAFALKMEVNEGTVSYWKSATNEPDLRALVKMAEVLACSVDWLLGVPESHAPVEIPPSPNPTDLARLGRALRDAGDAWQRVAPSLHDAAKRPIGRPGRLRRRE
jgi:transcriptional regulator with XRE-family HTH domain